MRAYYFIIFISTLFWSCSEEGAKPAFLKISEFELMVDPEEGSASEDITEAKITVDGQNLGLFHLPIEIPVLATGEADVIASPIIKQDGFVNQRVPYFFYEPHTQTVTFTPETTSELNLSTNYIKLPELDFWHEDFENTINFIPDLFSAGEMVRIEDPNLVFEGNACGFLEVTGESNIIQVSTQEEFEWPRGQAVFLELNFSNNVPFFIGAKAIQGVNIQQSDLRLISKKAENGEPNWNKMYLNLTNFIADNATAEYYELFFKYFPSAGETPELYFDNIKVIHPAE